MGVHGGCNGDASLEDLVGEAVVLESAEHQPQLSHSRGVHWGRIPIHLCSLDSHKLVPRQPHCAPLSLHGVELGLVGALWGVLLIRLQQGGGGG